MKTMQVSDEDLHADSLTSNWWCCVSLVLIDSSALRLPNAATKQWLPGFLECGPWVEAGESYSKVKPACSLLLSSMPCLWLHGGSSVTAVTVSLMLLILPLTVARDLQRKCTPGFWAGEGWKECSSFYHCVQPVPLECRNNFFGDCISPLDGC